MQDIEYKSILHFYRRTQKRNNKSIYIPIYIFDIFCGERYNTEGTFSVPAFI